MSPLRFAAAAAPAQAVAFSVRSSLAALPAMITAVRDTLGLGARASGFTLPLAVSVFRINVPIAWVVGLLFLGKLYGVPMPATTLAMLVLTATLLSYSVPGLPSASLFLLSPVLALTLTLVMVMALMAAAMMIKAEVPGPQWMGASPDLFWGLLVSMAVGNLLLLVLNGPLVGLWAACLKWSYRVVAPVLVLVAAVGLYGLNLRPSDILLATALMLAGYTLYRMGCEPGPMLLGFVMAPLMERHLRQALQAHDGHWGVVFSHPLALGMMLVAALLFLMAALPAIRAQRDETFVE